MCHHLHGTEIIDGHCCSAGVGLSRKNIHLRDRAVDGGRHFPVFQRLLRVADGLPRVERVHLICHPLTRHLVRRRLPGLILGHCLVRGRFKLRILRPLRCHRGLICSLGLGIILCRFCQRFLRIVVGRFRSCCRRRRDCGIVSCLCGSLSSLISGILIRICKSLTLAAVRFPAGIRAGIITVGRG